MTRIVSVWLPHWPIERLKRAAGTQLQILDARPFVLVEAGEKGLRITAVNSAAARQDIHADMKLADARACIPHLRSCLADPAQDSRALLKLVRWCGRYSPTLNVDGEASFWIEIAGTAHLFGGEQELLRDLENRLGHLGITARTGLADTVGAAWALARFAHTEKLEARCAAPRESQSKLAPLPVEALRLEEKTVRLLGRLGLKRIGQLINIPRAELKRRFPSKQACEAVLTRLDQALGVRQEPGVSLPPLASYAVRIPFPEPLISTEPVETALAKLSETLCAKLSADHQGARQLLFSVYRTDGTCAWTRVGTSLPCHTPAHIVRLFKEKLEILDAGFGIDLMMLVAEATEHLPPEQQKFKSENRENHMRPGQLIDQLANRFGRSRVFRLSPRASHIPEDAQIHCPAQAEATLWQKEEGSEHLRPFRLLARPEPISVIAEIPDGPPVRFTWRRVTRRVLKAEGPERIAPEWWRELDYAPEKTGEKTGEVEENLDEKTRDYFRLEDEEGRRYWVFRVGLYSAQTQKTLPAWYLHGFFG